MRLPSPACLAGAWAICRWSLEKIMPATADAAARTAARWALAGSFLIGAVAWDVTLRPEPFVALLAAGVLGCSVRFVLAPSPRPLAVAVVLCAFAVTANVAGLVAISPLLVIAPQIF